MTITVNKAHWEQGEWDVLDHELSLTQGREINHVHAEDVRKRLWLFGYGWNADSQKITDYKLNRFWDEIMPVYAALPESYARARWIRQSRHGELFKHNDFGGGTCYYQNNYIHNITKFEIITVGHHADLQPYLGQVAVLVGAGSYHKDSSQTNVSIPEDRSVSAADAHSKYNRFRVGTPVEVISTSNTLCARILAKIYADGILYLFLTPTAGALVAAEETGTISCWFGGDYYMTWKNTGTYSGFSWEEAHFRETDSYNIWSVGDIDTRPPDGGVLSDNLNIYWCRTVNPYLYHHWDYNANRTIGWAYVFGTGNAAEFLCSDYPSYIFYPRQTDPRENDEPIWITSTDKGCFKEYNKVELAANQLTQTANLGPQIPMAYTCQVVAATHYPSGTTGDQQYTGVHDGGLDTVTGKFSKLYLPYHLISDDLLEPFAPSPKLLGDGEIYTDYQSACEYACSQNSYMAYVPDTGGGDWCSAYRTNYLAATGESSWDPAHEVNQTSFPYTGSCYWGCNGSTFELALWMTGDYDWYFDESYPNVPTNIAHAWFEMQSHGLEFSEAQADARYPRPVGTWRRTWKWSLGRINEWMTETSPTANETATPNDWGIRGYNHDPSFEIHWSGYYVSTVPKCSVFRTNYKAIDAQDATTVTIVADTIADGTLVQFVVDIDGTIASSNHKGSANLLWQEISGGNLILHFAAVPAGASYIQWNTNVATRHDPSYIQGTTPYYEKGYQILRSCREVLSRIQYREVEGSFQYAAYSDLNFNGWTQKFFNENGDHFDNGSAGYTAGKNYLTSHVCDDDGNGATPAPGDTCEGNMTWLMNPTQSDDDITTSRTYNYYNYQGQIFGWGDVTDMELVSVAYSFYTQYHLNVMFEDPDWKTHWTNPSACSTFALRPYITDDEDTPTVHYDFNRPPVEQDLFFRVAVDMGTDWSDVKSYLGIYCGASSNSGSTYDTWADYKVIPGINGLSINIGALTLTYPTPELNMNFVGEDQGTLYGHLSLTLKNIAGGWYVCRFDLGGTIGTAYKCDTSNNLYEPGTQTSPQVFSCGSLICDLSSHSNIGCEMDPDKYDDALWLRDYTLADFYYSWSAANRSPWPDPAEWMVAPILDGAVDTNATVYDINGCSTDAGGDYFIVNSLTLINEDFERFVIASGHDTDWNGTYTVKALEEVATEIEWSSGNETRVKVYVNETIPDQAYDLTADWGDFTIVSNWKLTMSIKHCEDWEQDNPVLYRPYGTPADIDTIDMIPDYDADEAFTIVLGTTTAVYDLFENHSLASLVFQPQAQDSNTNATSINTTKNPPTSPDYAIWPPTDPFFSAFSITGTTTKTLTFTVDPKFCFSDKAPVEYKVYHSEYPTTLLRDYDESNEGTIEFDPATYPLWDASGKGWIIVTQNADADTLTSDILTGTGTRPT